MSIRNLVLLLAVIAVTAVGIATAHATNARTWVSGTGSDSGSCTRTAPCQTFSYALSQTNSGGEINCLDPGGFGALTITKSVTIDCEGASNGGITVSSGDGIDITTTGVVVNIIGLDIDGEGTATAGVEILAAATVNIRNCKIYNFPGVGGVLLQASGATLVVDDSLIANNAVGIDQYSSAGASNMSVRNSNINNSKDEGIVITMAGGAHAGATIEQTTLAFNNYGLLVQNSGAVALIGGSTVVNNNVGVFPQSGGVIYSFQNNQIGGNSTDGTPLTAYPGGPLN